jgi:aminomethyltransferase
VASSHQLAPARTALFECHQAAGARVVDFAGWEMPVQYPTGLRAEHLAVRQHCGIFDVSHMGQIEVSGPQAGELMQRLLSGDIASVPIGAAQYGVICREDGGILDDLITYRLEAQRYLTVTNASNHSSDLRWFQEQGSDFDASVEDRASEYAMLAVQGPQAREIVQAISGAALPPRMTAGPRRLAGLDVLVCGTGYTGEDGVELLCAPTHASTLWEEIVRRGAVPAGLGARDTLRLEACYPLYGNELSVDRNPIEAGLGWCCREETGFIGSEAVRAARAQGTEQLLAPFVMDGSGIPRQGNPVVGGGEVTSGTLSPTLGIGIGLAYLPRARTQVDTEIEIDVRGKIRRAHVVRRPLVKGHADQPSKKEST